MAQPAHPYPIYTVGLTGGIASGKSTVATELAQRGAAVVDTDAIAHALTAPGAAALEDISAAFGTGYLDAAGGLDRARMRARVFSDAPARKKLEAILHPRIHAEAQTALARAAAAGAPYAVAVVPLLVESAGWLERVDRVLLVDCDEALQLSRALQRGLAEDQVRAIMAAQAGRAARRRHADDILLNEDGLAALRTAVAALHDGYVKQAAEALPLRPGPSSGQGAV